MAELKSKGATELKDEAASGVVVISEKLFGRLVDTMERQEQRFAAIESRINLDELLTAEEVMAILKIGKSTVYQKAEAGQIPSVKVCGLLRFRREDIARLISEGAR